MTPQTPPTDRPLTASDWIEWHGGENPVPGQMVDVELRDGSDADYMNSDDLRWDHPCDDDDIIAYRLSRPAASEGVGELKADFTRSHPSGMDDSTYEQIEDALDRADAPIIGEAGRFLTLAQRVAALASPPVSERERELEGALRGAVPYLEALHSTCNGKEARGFVWGVIQKARALTAQPAGEGK